MRHMCHNLIRSIETKLHMVCFEFVKFAPKRLAGPPYALEGLKLGAEDNLWQSEQAEYLTA